MSNLLYEVEGQLPDKKEAILERISRYQQKTLMEKLEIRLNRRMRSYIAVYGGLDTALHQMVTETMNAIKSKSPDAEEKTNQAIAELKQGFI